MFYLEKVVIINKFKKCHWFETAFLQIFLLIDSIFLKTTMYYFIISLYTAALWWYYLIYFIHVEAESSALLTPIFT